MRVGVGGVYEKTYSSFLIDGWMEALTLGLGART